MYDELIEQKQEQRIQLLNEANTLIDLIAENAAEGQALQRKLTTKLSLIAKLEGGMDTLYELKGVEERDNNESSI